MSFRGRGRGRGGRFGGGRRPPIYLQRDANGNIIKLEPPLLFPEEFKNRLPPLPETSEKDVYMCSKRRRILSFCNNSPYFIEKPKQASDDTTARDGIAAEIERYSDKYKPKTNVTRPPLSSILKLAAAYFPSELLNQGTKKAREYKGTSVWTSGNDFGRLDKLENLEKRAAQREEKGEGKENEKKEGEDEGEEVEELEEEEDVEEDDYNQNFGFDDDEDYLEDFGDGGDDEGPVY